MSDRLLPAVVAVGLGTVLALVLLVPYVAVQYRRRGALGPGRVVLAFATLVYALALVAYVLLPLPQVGPDFCQEHGVDPQLVPFQFVADTIREGAETPAALVTNPALLGVGFNIMLFVPFGALYRHLTNHSIAATTALGAALSLLVELTQLTGVWSLFPCAYRIFDVDDLITNTTGVLIGAAMVAPLLRLLPGQQVKGPPQVARPLTAGRRLLGMFCDVLAVVLTGAALSVTLRAATQALNVPLSADLSRVAFWLLPALGQLALIWWTGATLGEHSIRVRPTTKTSALTPSTKLIRWAVGIGGYSLLNFPGVGLTSLFGVLLIVAHLVTATLTHRHRGLAYTAAGLHPTDSRDCRLPANGSSERN